MGSGTGRGGKAQHIGRALPAAEPGIQLGHGRIVGEQHGDRPRMVRGECRRRRGHHQGLDIRQVPGPAVRLDFHVDLETRRIPGHQRGPPDWAASAS